MIAMAASWPSAGAGDTLGPMRFRPILLSSIVLSAACSSDPSEGPAGTPDAASHDAADASELDVVADEGGDVEPDSPSVEPDDLGPLLEPILASSGVPALAALVADREQTLAIGVAGHRKADDPTFATVDDKWHIGSDTKAMTATLVALFVNEGLLSWSTTLDQALPDLATVMHADFRTVTIEQLLTMQGGIHDDAYSFPPDIEGLDEMTVVEQRAAIAEHVLSQPPAASPGSSHAYSNFGYIVVGAVLESIAGESWEELMRDRLFEPLGMSACGFGSPATTDAVDQPWSHMRIGGNLVPLAGAAADNPPFLGPAGTVHCSLDSWLQFARLHADGALGDSELLPSSAFVAMHTPAPGPESYAMGWGVLPLTQGKLLTHDGSNTMNYARVLVFTDPPTIMLIATNEGSEDHAVVAVDETTGVLIEQYGAGWSAASSL